MKKEKKTTIVDGVNIRWKCATCGNKCLQHESKSKPDVCGGCNKPDWKIMINQESYTVNGVDWIHPDGEI